MGAPGTSSTTAGGLESEEVTVLTVQSLPPRASFGCSFCF